MSPPPTHTVRTDHVHGGSMNIPTALQERVAPCFGSTALAVPVRAPVSSTVAKVHAPTCRCSMPLAQIHPSSNTLPLHRLPHFLQALYGHWHRRTQFLCKQ